MTMRLEKQNLFPKDLATWLRRAHEDSVRSALADRIVEAMAKVLPTLCAGAVSQRDVDILDDRYFTLEEQGNKVESRIWFCKARLASAAKELQSGNIERSVYELWHSQEEQNVAAFIAQLEKAEPDYAAERLV